MKKTLFAVSAALAALAMAPAANATVFNVVLSQDANTYTSGYSSNGGLSGFFSDTFNFSPFIGASSADISLTNVGKGTKKIVFSKIQLDGINLLPFLSGNVVSIADLPVAAGLHKLIIEGTAGGNASYGGNVNFTLAAVPEPATWAMMIAGIGAVGVAMRRRSATARVAFS